MSGGIMEIVLTGRSALVTGSSRGIGAAIARKLAQTGARVVVHANRSMQEAETVAAELAHNGGQAAVVQGDFATAAGVRDAVRAAFSKFGSLDILVNNAAIFEGGPVEQLTEDQIDKVLAVNVRSLLIATREFVLLTQSKHGRIVNISSIAGRLPSPGGSLYAASKAAVESLTRSHAVEPGPRGIMVNAIAPGTTLTEMSARGFPPDLLRLSAAVTPRGRLGRPEEIADAVVFLCSDAASWITGQVLGADGGQLTTTNVLRRIEEGVRRQIGDAESGAPLPARRK